MLGAVNQWVCLVASPHRYWKLQAAERVLSAPLATRNTSGGKFNHARNGTAICVTTRKYEITQIDQIKKGRVVYGVRSCA